jgi:hypothetical protein
MSSITDSNWYQTLSLVSQMPNIDDLRLNPEGRLVNDPSIRVSQEILQGVAAQVKSALQKASEYTNRYREIIIFHRPKPGHQKCMMTLDAVAQKVSQATWRSWVFELGQADRLMGEEQDIATVNVSINGNVLSIDLISMNSLGKVQPAHVRSFFAEGGTLSLDEHIPQGINLSPEDCHLFSSCVQNLPFFSQSCTDGEIVKLLSLAHHLNDPSMFDRICAHCSIDNRWNAALLIALDLLEPEIYPLIKEKIPTNEIASLFIPACFDRRHYALVLQTTASNYYGRTIPVEVTDIGQYVVGGHSFSPIGHIIYDMREVDLTFTSIVSALEKFFGCKVTPQMILDLIHPPMRSHVPYLNLDRVEGFTKTTLREFLLHFPLLSELYMPYYATDGWLDILEVCPNLYHLSVEGPEFSGAGLRSLISSQKELFSLTILNSPKFAEGNLRITQAFEKLRHLRIKNMSLNMNSLNFLSQLKQVTSLFINNCSLSGVLLERSVFDFSHLESLEISGLSLTVQTTSLIKRSLNLREDIYLEIMQ